MRLRGEATGMARSDRRDRVKTVSLAAALTFLAGWALWVTTPKPELSSIAWDSPFPATYAESHRGRTITEVSESLELLNVLAAVAAHDQRTGRGESENGPDPQLIEAFIPYADHPAVSIVREAVTASSLQALSGIFAYALTGEGLVRALPHTLPSFEERLAPHKETLASYASASGFQRFFQERRHHYDELAADFGRRANTERYKAWLDGEFPAVSHDALRFVVSPHLSGASFSHNFSGAGFSEIVVFVPAAVQDEPGGKDPAGRIRPAGEAFAEAAGHYVSRMTDRYIRIVNRVFANVAIWRAGSLTDAPAAIFNEYMKWAAYLLYARHAEAPAAYEEIAQAVYDRMRAQGYVHFESMWHRISKLHADRKEPLGALFPRIIREAITIANEQEAL